MNIEQIIVTAIKAGAAVHIDGELITITPWADEKPEPEEKPKKAPDPRKQNNVKELDIGKVKALRKAGWSYSKIADEMGVAPQTIANKLKADAVEKEGA